MVDNTTCKNSPAGGRELNYWEMVDRVLQAYECAKLQEKGAARDALAVLLVQLVNGCYLSEALEAFKRFSDTGERVVRVRAAMRRKTVHRAVVIPEPVERGRVPKRATVYHWLRKLGLGGTRSLPHAFLYESAREGFDVKRVLAAMGRRRMGREVRQRLRTLSPVLSQLETASPPTSWQQLWERMCILVPRGTVAKLARKAGELGFSSAAELVRALIYDLLYEEEDGETRGGAPA